MRQSFHHQDHLAIANEILITVRTSGCDDSDFQTFIDDEISKLSPENQEPVAEIINIRLARSCGAI